MTGKLIDMEIAKLEAKVKRLKEGSDEARATQAAIWLRKACELVEQLDSHVDAVAAAQHMIAAAEILGSFKKDS